MPNNPPHDALRNAVNRAIDGGPPAFVNQPARQPTLREAIFEASINAIVDRVGESAISFGPATLAIQRYHGHGYRCYSGILSSGEEAFLAAAVGPEKHSVFRITDGGHNHVADLSFHDGKVQGEAMDRGLPDSPYTSNREIASMLGRLRDEALEAQGLPFEFDARQINEELVESESLDPSIRR